MIFEVRGMTRADVAACVRIINHTIGLGGSTAHEEFFVEADFADQYLDEPDVANVVVLDGRIVGFQAAFEVEKGVFSIGSFTDQEAPAKGAGAAVFAKTESDCRALKGTSIIAKITADNKAGLAYYSKMGFAPDAVWPADHTRTDGTVVDRIVKRFNL